MRRDNDNNNWGFDSSSTIYMDSVLAKHGISVDEEQMKVLELATHQGLSGVYHRDTLTLSELVRELKIEDSFLTDVKKYKFIKGWNIVTPTRGHSFYEQEIVESTILYIEWFKEYFYAEQEPNLNIAHNTKSCGYNYYTPALIYTVGIGEILNNKDTRPFVRWIIENVVELQKLLDWDGIYTI
jgi:hypothetical protein